MRNSTRFKDRIPEVTIPRLSLYYRAVLESRKVDFISSEEIAGLTNLSAAQVRKDLTYFGQFGTPGKGYGVGSLKQKILEILGTNREWNIALIGVGNLGSALLAYHGFRKQGFKITCAFDNDLRKIGKTLEGVEVKDISELKDVVRAQDIQMAIVAVPKDATQAVVNLIVETGINAVLNFAPIRPQVPDNVEILNIDLSIELERLAYFLTKNLSDS